MKKRIITAAVLMAVLVPLVMIDLKYEVVIGGVGFSIVGTLFLALGIFLSMVASYEMMNMFASKHPTLKNLRFFIAIFNGVIVLIITKFGGTSFPIEILLLLAVILIIMFLTTFRKESTAYDLMAAITTIAYCGLMFGYVINIRYLEPFPPGETLIYLRGGRSFGYLFSIVIATDTFAYLFGSLFGKKRLAPDISPKKSVEGAIAGVIGGSLVGVAMIFYLKISNHSNSKELLYVILVGLFLSMFLSLTVQIGDLVASKIKRTFDIKDFGTIFPGHGGVIDRFDSLIYSGVAYYIIVQALYLILVR